MTLADGAITDVIKLMSSEKPDATIQATVSLKGGFNPCQYIQVSILSTFYVLIFRMKSN